MIGPRGVRGRILDPWAAARALGWAAATVLAATAVGVSLGKGHLKFALAPVVAVVTLVFARVPVAGYVAILWTVGTAVDTFAPPQFGVGGLQFAPGELLLWIAIGCLMFLPRDVRQAVARLSTQRESLVMLGFLAAIVAGIAVGVENGASVHVALYDVRSMLFYAAFWPALAALTRPRDRALVLRLVTLGAVVVVCLQIAQVIVGAGTQLFFVTSSDLSSTLSTENGFLRVRPPGLTTVYVVAAFALARVFWGPQRHRLRGWAVLAVALAGLAVSLNRNMLVGLVLGLAAAVLITPQRRRLMAGAAVVALVVAGFIIVSAGSSQPSNPIVARFSDITDYAQLKTQTLDDRYYENHIALQRIRSHPFGGLGWGPDYGAVLLSSDDGFLVTQQRPFMHEQYLWIWMRAGVLGLLALIGVLLFGLINGARWCRAKASDPDGWLGAGVVVAVVAIAASSNVAIYLTPPDSIVPLVGVLALAAVLRRDLARERANR
jgi:O-antigen ligase